MWLGKLSDEMQRTLQELLVACVTEGRAGQSGINPSSYPSQILCLAEQVLFTEHCEQAIHNDSLSEFSIELDAQLDSYTNSNMQQQVLEYCIANSLMTCFCVCVQSNGDDRAMKILELKLKALILDTIHNIDVVTSLVTKRIKSVSNWLWQKQLRCYLVKGNVCQLILCVQY